jgi:folate-binding protein YgfZ
MTETTRTSQPELSVIRVTGADARAFLHAQTTRSLQDLPATGRCLTAWLNAKGRVRALFEVVADGDSLWLVLPADNRDYVITELSRYILRAKVQIAAAGTDELPDALAAISLAPTDADALVAIRRGIPQITAALRERYIPQMLNLDRLDAVSFTKGCYPGQEIVARSANLGEVKRRIRRFTFGDGDRPVPGDAIVSADGQSAGEINRIAATDSGFELLAVVPVTAEQLSLADDGRAIRPEPLAT